MPNVPRATVDSLPPVYASHFLLTINEGCLLIEASSGLAGCDVGDGGTLPINCRLAVPWNAAQRLAAVLNSAIARHSLQEAGGDSATSATASGHAAQLPRLEV
jgi:hypothetical protein